MTRKYIVVADDSIKGFDEEIAKLEREWGAEEIEPCEDCISRKDAIKEFQSYREYSSNRTNNEWVDRIEGVLKLLPSVTPQRMQEVNADEDSD